MNANDFKRKKEAGKKITMLTCYDYPSARIAADTDIDCLLVGDSLAMVVHGHPSTVHATLEMMVLHTQAVARGLGNQFLISDMPFLSYQGSFAQTVENVRRLIQAGAHAVKLEGADQSVCQTIQSLTQAGIAVVGHIGLTPQSVHQLGGYRVQGKSNEEAVRLLAEAKKLEEAGCLALVLECIPSQLARSITANLSIPTIGIGAGPHTDGQVLVWHDVLGLQTEIKPKFLKQYAVLKPLILDALNTYSDQVQNQLYPNAEYSYES